jgi:hypothetical protein
VGTSEGSVLEPIREYRNVTADLFRGEILARGQPRHALPGADLCGHRRPLLHRRLEGEYVTDTTTPAAPAGRPARGLFMHAASGQTHLEVLWCGAVIQARHLKLTAL